MKYLLLITICWLPKIWAATVHSGDYQNRADVSAFITRFAKQSAYDEAELVALFSQVKKQSQLFDRLDRPAEKTLEWHAYRRIFMQDRRIEKGVEFWRKHQGLLSSVAEKTGVPAEIIVAIIGVETFYGVYTGKDRVFDSLVTISFDYPQRTRFFTTELEQFLLLVKEQQLDASKVMGSYAGAMGMPQFISSSYRHYAVDGDGDGRINLFDNIADVVASVANYFVHHGWQADEAIAKPLVAAQENTIDTLETGVKPRYQWAEMRDHGFSTKYRIHHDTSVALIKLEQKTHSEYWAGLHNFYVITRYNHSALYAMAVYQLALSVKAEMKKAQ